MRTRDEVLREFGTGVNCDYASFVQAAHALADRIRELEAQRAASEPVAWADRLADAVRKLVRVLNDGDDVSALALALEATEKALAQFDDSKRCCGLCDAGECKYEIAPPSAASEPVAWGLCDKHGTVVLADTETDYIGKALIEFNRDYPDDSPHTLRPLVFAHPSAAAVRVTDAMVRAAFVRLYPGCEPDEMQHYHAADIRAALTAALAGPTTPTRGRDE